MVHLATIRLSEVASFDFEGLLPREGLLSAWYDVSFAAWGHRATDAGGFALTYEPAESGPLSLAGFPGDRAAMVDLPNPDSASFEPCRVSFERGLTLPGWQFILAFEPEADIDVDRLWEMTEALTGNGLPQHRLLGHPSTQQELMEGHCHFVTKESRGGAAEIVRDPLWDEMPVAARDWRLVLQLDTDDQPGWMWGDVGMLYFWMRVQDLAARDFAKAWCILQCG